MDANQNVPRFEAPSLVNVPVNMIDKPHATMNPHPRSAAWRFGNRTPEPLRCSLFHSRITHLLTRSLYATQVRFLYHVNHVILEIRASPR